MKTKIEDLKFGIVGGGKMAEAIMAGILESKLLKTENICVQEIDVERIHYLKNRYGIKVCQEAEADLKQCGVVMLAIKPQDFRHIEALLKKIVTDDQKIIVTILAGVHTQKIAALFDFPVKIARMMPNLGAFVRQSVTGVFFNAHVNPDEAQKITRLFETVGDVLKVREDQLDAITAASGSGPAYIFYFLESYMSAVESLGFSHAEAKQLCVKTMEGALSVLKAHPETEPREWQHKVTSKGGTTEKAIQVLNASEFNCIVKNALMAAFKRSVELSQ